MNGWPSNLSTVLRVRNKNGSLVSNISTSQFRLIDLNSLTFNDDYMSSETANSNDDGGELVLDCYCYLILDDSIPKKEISAKEPRIRNINKGQFPALKKTKKSGFIRSLEDVEDFELKDLDTELIPNRKKVLTTRQTRQTAKQNKHLDINSNPATLQDISNKYHDTIDIEIPIERIRPDIYSIQSTNEKINIEDKTPYTFTIKPLSEETVQDSDQDTDLKDNSYDQGNLFNNLKDKDIIETVQNIHDSYDQGKLTYI